MALEAGAKVWTHSIYPHEPFVVTLEYLTEILTSRDGTEQRRAWRSDPRKQVEFTCLLANDCFRDLKREIEANQRAAWAVPDISRKVLSTTTMGDSATQITVASVPDWLVQDESYILIDKDRVEVRSVAGIAGSVVTFNEVNSAVEWPIGTLIVPALPARLSKVIRGQRRRPYHIDLKIIFDVTPGLEYEYEPVAAAGTFDTIELFTTPPRKVQPVDIVSDSNLEITDYGVGVLEFNEPIEFITEVARYLYEPCDADAMSYIEGVFRRMKGRRGSFYMPTFAADFRPTGTDLAGTNSITVAGAKTATDFAGSDYFDAIAVQYADGTWQALSIIGLTVVGENSKFTLGSVLSQDVSAANIIRISWLKRRRFSSDRLIVSWKYGQPEVIVSVQDLENSEPPGGVAAVTSFTILRESVAAVAAVSSFTILRVAVVSLPAVSSYTLMSETEADAAAATSYTFLRPT